MNKDVNFMEEKYMQNYSQKLSYYFECFERLSNINVKNTYMYFCVH